MRGLKGPSKYKALRNNAPRKRVLILPFINDTIKQDAKITNTGRRALIKSLKFTDNFIVLQNTDLPGDLKNHYKNGRYDMEAIMKMAAPLGITAIVEGRIIEIKVKRWGDEVGIIRNVKAEVESTVGVRVISTMNNREILNDVRTASSISKSSRVFQRGSRAADLMTDPKLIKDSLRKGFQDMTLGIVKSVDKISWKGKVALVSGNRIYLNAGRMTGINIGEILRVTEDGEDIYDPQTGILIGKGPGRLKGTLEVVSYFGKDGCVSVIHSGSGIRENDNVELY